MLSAGGTLAAPAEAEWVEKFKGKFDMGGTPCASDFCKPEALSLRFRQGQAHDWPD